MISLSARMEITTVVGCAINCRYCPQQLFVQQYQKKKDSVCAKQVMSFECFRKYIDKLDSDILICFAGMSEPWLNAECTQMVKYAYKKNHKIAIYTTLVGMTLDDFNQIKDIPFDEFVVHLPDENNYSMIRITDEYLQVLKAVVSYKNNGIGIVTDYSCYGDIALKVRNIIPADAVSHTNFNDRAGNLTYENITHTMKIEGEFYCIRCKDRLDQNVLLPDGTVLLCCMDYGMKHILGNLNTDTYAEIMKSSEADYIRQQMHCGEDSILCRRCVNAKTIHEIFDFYQDYYNWANELYRENTKLRLACYSNK